MSDFALPVVLGIALAAATGFRVFLPMLIVSAAAYTGHLSLDDSFAWLGTPAALIMLSVAALVEVLVVDNLLDSLATPAAFIAGTVVSAAVMSDVPPMVKWTAAVIAGGGIAGLTQGVTAILRAHSTAWTGGLGNSVIATAELGGALLISPPGPGDTGCGNRVGNSVSMVGDTLASPAFSRVACKERPKIDTQRTHNTACAIDIFRWHLAEHSPAP